MQPPDPTPRISRFWIGTGLVAVAIVAVAVAVYALVFRPDDEGFTLPVSVFVCGSAIDLDSVSPDEAPIGCIVVPTGIELEFSDRNVPARAYKDGGFSFRDLDRKTSNSTLIATGAIETSTIGMVTLNTDGSRWSGQMEVRADAEAETTWEIEMPVSPEWTRLIVYIVTSPDSPQINA